MPTWPNASKDLTTVIGKTAGADANTYVGAAATTDANKKASPYANTTGAGELGGQRTGVVRDSFSSLLAMWNARSYLLGSDLTAALPQTSPICHSIIPGLSSNIDIVNQFLWLDGKINSIQEMS